MGETKLKGFTKKKRRQTEMPGTHMSSKRGEWVEGDLGKWRARCCVDRKDMLQVKKLHSGKEGQVTGVWRGNKP